MNWCWAEREAIMNSAREGISFYFFDFDDNIMILNTHIYVRNTTTNQERAVTTGEYAILQAQLGHPGPWEDYALFDGSFRDFRDVPASSLAPGEHQKFVKDVADAIDRAPSMWQGPSWKFFVYACEQQRPVSLITARGHSPETLKEGISLLVNRSLLPRPPRYFRVYAVGNERVRLELGDARNELTIPALKRRAIIITVDAALSEFGEGQRLRFGISDDDPQNVSLAIRAMCECKKRHPDERFFVINTHMNEEVKMEIFPVDSPAPRQ